MKKRKANLVLRDEDGEESTLVEQAADSLSSAFESFEEVLSQGVSSMFTSEEPAPADTQKTIA